MDLERSKAPDPERRLSGLERPEGAAFLNVNRRWTQMDTDGTRSGTQLSSGLVLGVHQ